MKDKIYSQYELNQAVDKNGILALVIGLVVGFVVCSLFWLGSSNRKEKKPAVVSADDMIMVTILSKQNDNGDIWHLVEAEDGQRGYIDVYRGDPGEKFLIEKRAIGDYKRIAPGTIEPPRGEYKFVKPGAVVPNDINPQEGF